MPYICASLSLSLSLCARARVCVRVCTCERERENIFNWHFKSLHFRAFCKKCVSQSHWLCPLPVLAVYKYLCIKLHLPIKLNHVSDMHESKEISIILMVFGLITSIKSFMLCKLCWVLSLVTEYSHLISYFHKYICQEIWIQISTIVFMLWNFLFDFNIILCGQLRCGFAIAMIRIVLR
jgi:hypothetical protein